MLIPRPAHQDVGKAEGASGDTYGDLALAGLQVGDVDETHDVGGPAEGFDVPRSHRASEPVMWWIASCKSARVVRK